MKHQIDWPTFYAGLFLGVVVGAFMAVAFILWPL